jgi:hypothetical protein
MIDGLIEPPFSCMPIAGISANWLHRLNIGDDFEIAIPVRNSRGQYRSHL